MEQTQPETTRPTDDGFSQFFIEPTPPKPEFDCALSSDAQEVMANLLKAYKRLRAASYRIGQLEGRLVKYRRLSRTLISQAASNKIDARNLKRSAQAAPTNSSGHIPSYEGDSTEYDHEEISWWQALAEVMLGPDSARSAGREKRNRSSEYGYYDLIRLSVNR